MIWFRSSLNKFRFFFIFISNIFCTILNFVHKLWGFWDELFGVSTWYKLCATFLTIAKHLNPTVMCKNVLIAHWRSQLEIAMLWNLAAFIQSEQWLADIRYFLLKEMCLSVDQMVLAWASNLFITTWITGQWSVLLPVDNQGLVACGRLLDQYWSKKFTLTLDCIKPA